MKEPQAIHLEVLDEFNRGLALTKRTGPGNEKSGDDRPREKKPGLFPEDEFRR